MCIDASVHTAKKKHMKAIGLIPMSAKPYHAGHHMLVTLASRECDVVIVITSTTDRGGQHEHTVTWNAMDAAWKLLIEPVLPQNVTVIKCQSSPIRYVYELLGKASDDDQCDDAFTVYAGTNDAIANFPIKSQLKYFQRLIVNKMFNVKTIDRDSTNIASGTLMRRCIMVNDFTTFARYVAPGINSHAMWKLLTER